MPLLAYEGGRGGLVQSHNQTYYNQNREVEFHSVGCHEIKVNIPWPNLNPHRQALEPDQTTPQFPWTSRPPINFTNILPACLRRCARNFIQVGSVFLIDFSQPIIRSNLNSRSFKVYHNGSYSFLISQLVFKTGSLVLSSTQFARHHHHLC